MKVSRAWLQKYFEKELPSVAELSDAFTFHAFEVEETADDLIDLKVLPDRAAYGLSHRGIAYELSAILNIPLKEDPLRTPLPQWQKSTTLQINVETKKSARQMGALVQGVRVGPSPVWLKEALEAVGQRSINNIVDATNYVTLNMGQPLHAFDAKKIAWQGETLPIVIRETGVGEKVTTLSGEEYLLPQGTVVIAEGVSLKPLDIAGVKGGQASAIDEATTDLYVSVANFDATSVRKTAQALKLFTDASTRFQNRISPELVAYGMRDVLALIQDIAGGTLEGVVDVYDAPVETSSVLISREMITNALGAPFTAAEIEDVFRRLQFSFTEHGGVYTVTAPFERRDVVLAADVVEEVGRILGYDRVPSVPLLAGPDVEKAQYLGLERVKDFFAARGYSEISTPSFAEQGEVLLSNPLQQEKPWLRAELSQNMREALTRALSVAPRVLGPTNPVQLFELGSVFTKEGEQMRIAWGEIARAKKGTLTLEDTLQAFREELSYTEAVAQQDQYVYEAILSPEYLEQLGALYVPRPIALQKFKMFSLYPAALRDIAVWTPVGTEGSEVVNVLVKEGGELLVRTDLFDQFEKDGRVSYAFSLVFESFEKTLSDEDITPCMERITTALNGRENWQVR